MLETFTEEEIRQYTKIPDIDEMLEDYGYTLEEVLQNQTNLVCGGVTPSSGRNEHTPHIPTSYYKINNSLVCLICGYHLEVKTPDESQEISEEYVIKSEIE